MQSGSGAMVSLVFFNFASAGVKRIEVPENSHELDILLVLHLKRLLKSCLIYLYSIELLNLFLHLFSTHINIEPLNTFISASAINLKTIKT